MDGAPEDAQEERVKKLWEKLDTTNEGYLDLAGLKKGFAKIDHRESHEFFTCRSCRCLEVRLFPRPSSFNISAKKKRSLRSVLWGASG